LLLLVVAVSEDHWGKFRGGFLIATQTASPAAGEILA
jgi:hypothetical protein